MSARILYDSLEQIPETARQHAVKTANGFEVDAQPLLDNHAQLQTELQRFRAAAEKFDGLDPAAARRALEEVQRLQQQDRDIEKAVEVAKKNAGREREHLLRHITDSAIGDAITRAGGNPVLLRPHVAALVRADYQNGDVSLNVLDDKYHNVRRDVVTGKPVTLDELVGELKHNPNYTAAFAGTTTSATTSATTTTNATQAGSQQFQPSNGKIRLTREQGKNAQIYREALASVGGRVDLIELEPYRPNL